MNSPLVSLLRVVRQLGWWSAVDALEHGAARTGGDAERTNPPACLSPSLPPRIGSDKRGERSDVIAPGTLRDAGASKWQQSVCLGKMGGRERGAVALLYADKGDRREESCEMTVGEKAVEGGQGRAVYGKTAGRNPRHSERASRACSAASCDA